MFEIVSEEWHILDFFFNVFYFIFGTERDRAWTGEGQREKETQNRKQAPGSEPSARSRTRDSNSRTVRSWPGWSRTLNRLRHPGAPILQIVLRSTYIYTTMSEILLYDIHLWVEVMFYYYFILFTSLLAYWQEYQGYIYSGFYITVESLFLRHNLIIAEI